MTELRATFTTPALLGEPEVVAINLHLLSINLLTMNSSGVSTNCCPYNFYHLEIKFVHRDTKNFK